MVGGAEAGGAGGAGGAGAGAGGAGGGGGAAAEAGAGAGAATGAGGAGGGGGALLAGDEGAIGVVELGLTVHASSSKPLAGVAAAELDLSGSWGVGVLPVRLGVPVR